MFLQVAFRGMPLYAMLPTVTEYCVEQGWTLAYARYDRWRGDLMAAHALMAPVLCAG